MDKKGRLKFNLPFFFMCAQHGRLLVGEIPIRRLIVPTVSLRQGCPLWGGIWRKSAAKLRSEEHESHIRHMPGG